MKIILIGHRGVGKSKALESFNKDFCFDLDKIIEQSEQQSIEEIFKNFGEAHFRELERKYFKQLIKKPNYIISLGAGSQVEVPKEADVIWLQRQTDTEGRIFLNRPRLNPSIDPLQEWNLRFKNRESLYKKLSTQCLLLPEGDFNLEDFIKEYFEQDIYLKNYYLTLNSYYLKIIPQRIRQNIGGFELRDDLLSEQECKYVEGLTDQLLYSVRTTNTFFKNLEQKYTDWAIELGEPPFTPSIVSTHSHKLLPMAMKYENQCHIKWSPIIENFEQLLEGHDWWQQSPHTRSFLPRSKNGRWYWYRLMWGHKMKVKFYKEDRFGSSSDQPSLYQIHSFNPDAHQSYAVIGCPVLHSWTPEFHKDFFKPKNGFAIEVQSQEFDVALKLFESWGIHFLAVTSPLKECFDHSMAVNTLAFFEGKWKATNTDIIALQKILKQHPSCALWGGGGIRQQFVDHFPGKPMYSSRTKECLNDQEVSGVTPEALIWAVPNRYAVNTPPFIPNKVIDLNYFENSLARTFALEHKIEYLSGESFFVTQALAQQKFWKAMVKN